MAESGDIIINIVATNEEVEEGMNEIEVKVERLEQQVLAPAETRARNLFQTLRNLEADARKTFIGIDGMIRNSFAIMRTVLRMMGVSYDAVAQSTMALFEVMIQSLRDITRAQAIYAAGDPLGAAKIAVSVGLSMAASVMLVTAQASARQDFMEIQARITASNVLLDLITR